MTKLRKINLKTYKLLSIFKTPQLARVEEAIKMSGRTELYIIKDKNSPNEYFGLYSNSIADCSDFWNIYRELQNSKEWQIYEQFLGYN